MVLGRSLAERRPRWSALLRRSQRHSPLGPKRPPPSNFRTSGSRRFARARRSSCSQDDNSRTGCLFAHPAAAPDLRLRPGTHRAVWPQPAPALSLPAPGARHYKPASTTKKRGERPMAEGGKLMAGKRGLVLGVANNRSIAWGIAKAVTDQGAELALTYQGDAIKKRVEPLAAEIGSKLVLPCDVTDEASVDCGVHDAGEGMGQARFPGACHRLLRQGPSSTAATSTPREKNFTQTHADLLLLVHRAGPARREADAAGGSMLTLTYYGAEKVMPHYNVMGVAKAALEASVRYLAADLGTQRHPRQRHLGRADQDAGRVRHRRLPLHPEVERVQLAAAPHRDDRGGRRRRPLSAVGPVAAASPARCTTSMPATTWQA